MSVVDDQTHVLYLNIPRAEILDPEPPLGCLPSQGWRMLACGVLGMMVGTLMTLSVLGIVLFG